MHAFELQSISRNVIIIHYLRAKFLNSWRVREFIFLHCIRSRRFAIVAHFFRLTFSRDLLCLDPMLLSLQTIPNRPDHVSQAFGSSRLFAKVPPASVSLRTLDVRSIHASFRLPPYVFFYRCMCVFRIWLSCVCLPALKAKIHPSLQPRSRDYYQIDRGK